MGHCLPNQQQQQFLGAVPLPPPHFQSPSSLVLLNHFQCPLTCSSSSSALCHIGRSFFCAFVHPFPHFPQLRFLRPLPFSTGPHMTQICSASSSFLPSIRPPMVLLQGARFNCAASAGCDGALESGAVEAKGKGGSRPWMAAALVQRVSPFLPIPTAAALYPPPFPFPSSVTLDPPNSQQLSVVPPRSGAPSCPAQNWALGREKGRQRSPPPSNSPAALLLRPSSALSFFKFALFQSSAPVFGFGSPPSFSISTYTTPSQSQSPIPAAFALANWRPVSSSKGPLPPPFLYPFYFLTNIPSLPAISMVY